jgi:hypothetical protein
MEYSDINYSAIELGTTFDFQRRWSLNDLTSPWTYATAKRVVAQGRLGFHITCDLGSGAESPIFFDDEEERSIEGNKMYYKLNQEDKYSFLGKPGVDSKAHTYTYGTIPLYYYTLNSL